MQSLGGVPKAPPEMMSSEPLPFHCTLMSKAPTTSHASWQQPPRPPRSLLDSKVIVTAGRLVMAKQFTKLVAAFRLAAQQLSAQHHYDFGMRAVNTVLRAAGNNRQANPDMMEDLLVLSALADSNRPKFLAEDMLLFNGNLSDLQP